MSTHVSWARHEAQTAGARMLYARAGKGRTVMILHHDIGSLEQLAFYDAVATKYDVIVPYHPGFGISPRADWLRHPRDIAVIYQALLADLGVAQVSLVGLGFGGWIAAEMACFAPAALHRLVLAGAMGIKPPTGDIMDQALVNYIEYARAGFNDQTAFDAVYGAEPSTDQLEIWDICREMSFRVAWKPYMYSQSLPHLIAGTKTPALVVWGENDAVVPLSAGKVYAERLPHARFEMVAGCGHCVDMEQPAKLAALVTGFID